MPRRPLNVTPLEAETAPIPPLPPGLHKKPGKRTSTVNDLIDHNIHKIIDIELYRCLNLKDGRACEYLLNRRLGLPKIHLESVNLNINADDLAKQLAASQSELAAFLQTYAPPQLLISSQKQETQSIARDDAALVDITQEEAPSLSDSG